MSMLQLNCCLSMLAPALPAAFVFCIHLIHDNVGFFFDNVHHAGLQLFVHVDVVLSPLFLMNLVYMPAHVPFAVVVVTTNGALVRFDPGIYVELEVPHQVYALVKHFVTMQALQVKVFVLVHVVLEPVLMRERLATQVAKYGVFDVQVNW